MPELFNSSFTSMYRVILDFTSIENIFEKFVWHAVDTLKFSKIREFKATICESFGLKNINFYVKNALLREEDSIFIIRDEDTIRIMQKFEQPLQNMTCNQLSEINECKKVSVKKRSKKNLICDNQTNSEIMQNDHVTLSNQDSVELCNQVMAFTDLVETKKKKQKKMKFANDICATSEDKNENISNNDLIESSSICEPSKLRSLFSEINMELLPESSQNLNKNSSLSNTKNVNSNTDTVLTNVNNSIKKRRRRPRRRRLKEDPLIFSSEILQENVKFVTTENSSILSSLNSVSVKENRHIKFSDSSGESDDKPSISESVVQFNCIDNKKREDSYSQASSSSAAALESKSLITNGSITHYNNNNSLHDYQLFSNKSLPSSLNIVMSAQKLLSYKTHQDKEKTENLKALTAMTKKYSPLTVMPKVGVYIAYKVLELNDAYCPEVSNFKEGLVKEIDSYGNILIEFLQQEIKQPRSGKFEVEFSDDEDPEAEPNKVVVNWNDMIEPQIISQPNQNVT